MQGLGMGGLGGLQMQHMNPNAMGSMSAANGMSSSMASAGMSAVSGSAVTTTSLLAVQDTAVCRCAQLYVVNIVAARKQRCQYASFTAVAPAQQQQQQHGCTAGMGAAALGSSSSSSNSMNPPVMSMQGAGSLLNRQHQQLLAAQRQTAMLQQQSAMLRAQSPQFRAGLSPNFSSPGYRTGYQLP
eukprot:20638-Heterococcus_DN1.PRE.1